MGVLRATLNSLVASMGSQLSRPLTRMQAVAEVESGGCSPGVELRVNERATAEDGDDIAIAGAGRDVTERSAVGRRAPDTNQSVLDVVC